MQVINGLQSEYGLKSIGVIGMWCARYHPPAVLAFAGDPCMWSTIDSHRQAQRHESVALTATEAQDA